MVSICIDNITTMKHQKRPSQQARDVKASPEGSSSTQPALLLSLAKGPSYGYGLLQALQELGLRCEGSTLYKQLRAMEQEGWVESHWHTEGRGPAKRFYTLTQEGVDLLQTWMVSIEDEKRALERLLAAYRAFLKRCGDGSCGCGCGKLVKLEFTKQDTSRTTKK